MNIQSSEHSSHTSSLRNQDSDSETQKQRLKEFQNRFASLGKYASGSKNLKIDSQMDGTEIRENSKQSFKYDFENKKNDSNSGQNDESKRRGAGEMSCPESITRFEKRNLEKSGGQMNLSLEPGGFGAGPSGSTDWLMTRFQDLKASSRCSHGSQQLESVGENEHSEIEETLNTMSSMEPQDNLGVNTVNLSSLKDSEMKVADKDDLAEMEFFDPNKVVMLSSASREWQNVNQQSRNFSENFEEKLPLYLKKESLFKKKHQELQNIGKNEKNEDPNQSPNQTEHIETDELETPDSNTMNWESRSNPRKWAINSGSREIESVTQGQSLRDYQNIRFRKSSGESLDFLGQNLLQPSSQTLMIRDLDLKLLINLNKSIDFDSENDEQLAEIETNQIEVIQEGESGNPSTKSPKNDSKISMIEETRQEKISLNNDKQFDQILETPMNTVKHPKPVSLKETPFRFKVDQQPSSPTDQIELTNLKTDRPMNPKSRSPKSNQGDRLSFAPSLQEKSLNSMNTSNYESGQGEVFRCEFSIPKRKAPDTIQSVRTGPRSTENKPKIMSLRLKQNELKSHKGRAVKNRNDGEPVKNYVLEELEGGGLVPIESENSKEGNWVESFGESRGWEGIRSIVEMATGNVVDLIRENPEFSRQIWGDDYVPKEGHDDGNVKVSKSNSQKNREKRSSNQRIKDVVKLRIEKQLRANPKIESILQEMEKKEEKEKSRKSKASKKKKNKSHESSQKSGDLNPEFSASDIKNSKIEEPSIDKQIPKSLSETSEANNAELLPGMNQPQITELKLNKIKLAVTPQKPSLESLERDKISANQENQNGSRKFSGLGTYLDLESPNSNNGQGKDANEKSREHMFEQSEGLRSLKQELDRVNGTLQFADPETKTFMENMDHSSKTKSKNPPDDELNPVNLENTDELQNFIETNSYLESRELKNFDRAGVSQGLNKTIFRILRIEDEKELTREMKEALEKLRKQPDFVDLNLHIVFKKKKQEIEEIIPISRNEDHKMMNQVSKIENSDGKSLEIKNMNSQKTISTKKIKSGKDTQRMHAKDIISLKSPERKTKDLLRIEGSHDILCSENLDESGVQEKLEIFDLDPSQTRSTRSGNKKTLNFSGKKSKFGFDTTGTLLVKKRKPRMVPKLRNHQNRFEYQSELDTIFKAHILNTKQNRFFKALGRNGSRSKSRSKSKSKAQTLGDGGRMVNDVKKLGHAQERVAALGSKSLNIKKEMLRNPNLKMNTEKNSHYNEILPKRRGLSHNQRGRGQFRESPKMRGEIPRSSKSTLTRDNPRRPRRLNRLISLDRKNRRNYSNKIDLSENSILLTNLNMPIISRKKNPVKSSSRMKSKTPRKSRNSKKEGNKRMPTQNKKKRSKFGLRYRNKSHADLGRIKSKVRHTRASEKVRAPRPQTERDSALQKSSLEIQNEATYIVKMLNSAPKPIVCRRSKSKAKLSREKKEKRNKSKTPNKKQKRGLTTKKEADQCQSLQVSKVHKRIKKTEQNKLSQTVPDSWNPRVKRNKNDSFSKDKRTKSKNKSPFNKKSRKNLKTKKKNKKKTAKIKYKNSRLKKARSKSSKNNLNQPRHFQKKSLKNSENSTEELIQKKILKKILLMDSKKYKTDPVISYNDSDTKNKRMKPKKSVSKFKKTRNKKNGKNDRKYKIRKMKIGSNAKNTPKNAHNVTIFQNQEVVQQLTQNNFFDSKPDPENLNFMKNKAKKMDSKSGKRNKSRSKSKKKGKGKSKSKSKANTKSKEFTFRTEDITSTLQSINLGNPIILTQDSNYILRNTREQKNVSKKTRKKTGRKRKGKNRKLKRKNSKKISKVFIESELVTVSKKSTNTLNDSEANKFEELLSKDTHKGRLLNGISYVDSLESSLAKNFPIDIRRSAGPEPLRTSLGNDNRLTSEQDHQRIGRGSLGDISTKKIGNFDEYNNGYPQARNIRNSSHQEANVGSSKEQEFAEDLIEFQNNKIREKLRMGVQRPRKSKSQMSQANEQEEDRISLTPTGFEPDQIVKDTLGSIQTDPRTSSPREGIFFESIEEERESLIDKEDNTTQDDPLTDNLKEDDLIIPSQNSLPLLKPQGSDAVDNIKPQIHNFQHMDFRRKSFGLVKSPGKPADLAISPHPNMETMSSQKSEEQTLDLEIAHLEELHRKESKLELHPTVRMKIQSSYPSLTGNEKNDLPDISQSYTAKDFIKIYQGHLDPNQEGQETKLEQRVGEQTNSDTQNIREKFEEYLLNSQVSRKSLKKIKTKKKRLKRKTKNKKTKKKIPLLKKKRKRVKKMKSQYPKFKESRPQNPELKKQIPQNLRFEELERMLEEHDSESRDEHSPSAEQQETKTNPTDNYFEDNRQKRFDGFRRNSSQSFDEESLTRETDEQAAPSTLFYRNSSQDNIYLQDELKNLQEQVEQDLLRSSEEGCGELDFHNSPHFGHKASEPEFDSNVDETEAETFIVLNQIGG